MATIATQLITALSRSGVQRVYGLPGDSLNGFTDAIRRSGDVTWEHVRHEETAAFAAAADAALTGRLAVCAGSCGPGNLHLINGLFDAQRSRVPVLAIAAHIPRSEIGSEYFQETHPQDLFRECSVYCELVSTPEMAPRIFEMAMRAAVEENGVAVVVVPGEIFLAPGSDTGSLARSIEATRSVIRPDEVSLRQAAQILNDGERVTILGGAGVQGAHDELVRLAGTLHAPVVHALRGKEFIEYDNPYDVGMTGLLGFASGYKAIKEADTLLMLGTDFPYQQFYPKDARIVQVDVRGRHLGRRTPIDLGLVGTVVDTCDALQPLLVQKQDRTHLD
ncbi:MAG: ubiquinone-dependent pyruvate dehydrogenase, partial [Mycolicibacterium sp.]|nr:ubiquinone-dependent pyruvate dehydrogenase [Mycolicibacterium sp.]